MTTYDLTQSEITRLVQLVSNEITRQPDNDMLIKELETIIEKLSKM